MSSGWLKFFGSKSESAAGFTLVGDALGAVLLGTADDWVEGDWMLPQPAPSTEMQDRPATKVMSAERVTQIPFERQAGRWATSPGPVTGRRKAIPSLKVDWAFRAGVSMSLHDRR